MKNSFHLLVIAFLFSSNFIVAQKTIKVKDIVGTAFISGDVSPNQAKVQALDDAKINALKKAGIEEHINTYQLLFTSQAKNDYSQFFSSDIQSEMQGAIKTFKIKRDSIYCKGENEIICEIIIDATVIKYETKSDNTFDANIEGIKGVYNNDDKLSFSIKTTEKAYLTIFNITDNEALLLYPNTYEKQQILDSSVLYKFPDPKISYQLHTDMKQQETNRLIFVFTKTPVPFIKIDKDQLTTQENIFTWIYSIMPDQRKVEYYTLTIQK